MDDMRAQVLDRVAGHLVAATPGRPVRVAVDGVTAAGKSTFARGLTAAVAARGRSSVHLSTDDFHHVAEHRHRDPDPARGYYRDAYDLARFRSWVLDPLGPGGDLRYRPRSHDLDTDELVEPDPVAAAPDTVVVVDGSFLQSAGLRDGWDEIVWLDASFESAAARGATRDADHFGGQSTALAAFAARYHAACRLYIAECDPIAGATVVVDNDDPISPLLRRLGSA